MIEVCRTTLYILTIVIDRLLRLFLVEGILMLFKYCYRSVRDRTYWEVQI